LLKLKYSWDTCDCKDIDLYTLKIVFYQLISRLVYIMSYVIITYHYKNVKRQH